MFIKCCKLDYVAALYANRCTETDVRHSIGKRTCYTTKTKRKTICFRSRRKTQVFWAFLESLDDRNARIAEENGNIFRYKLKKKKTEQGPWQFFNQTTSIRVDTYNSVKYTGQAIQYYFLAQTKVSVILYLLNIVVEWFIRSIVNPTHDWYLRTKLRFSVDYGSMLLWLLTYNCPCF